MFFDENTFCWAEPCCLRYTVFHRSNFLVLLQHLVDLGFVDNHSVVDVNTA